MEAGIIHTPTNMRDFLISGNTIPWEDEGRDPFYDQCEGDLPPFTTIKSLGKSPAATVDKVLCIKCQTVIARKLINCEQKHRQKSARREIACLKSLRHPHIVALVGAYFDGKSIGILLYPAAEFNLEQFMVDVPNVHNEVHLRRYFVCLAQAVSYLHDSKIRHKDIKPTNILVDSFYNVLLADFGISWKARDEAHMITQSSTDRSYDYCSPEVIAMRKRYPSSDVFSLGAVFAEMATVVLNRPLAGFREFRSSRDGDKSFHRNLDHVVTWMKDLGTPLDGEEEDDRHDEMIKAIPTILGMLAYKRDTPQDTDSGIDRPSASDLWKRFQNVSPYRCPDCDPHDSPWQHEPLSNDEHHLYSLRYFEDLSQESLCNSLPRREFDASTVNISRPTDSHDDKRAHDDLKKEILYNPQSQTLDMVALAEIQGNVVVLIGLPSCTLR